MHRLVIKIKDIQLVDRKPALTALNKSRLKYCIFFHHLLFFVMLAKLSADILDKLDIFVLEIEELRVPQPLLWEYLWCLSLLPSILSLSAIKKNQITTMKRAIIGTITLGLVPLIFCVVYYISECWRYLMGDYTVLEDTSEEDESDENAIQMWQGYPYCLLWFGFVILASQIHTFFVYFATNLIYAWEARGALRKQQ